MPNPQLLLAIDQGTTSSRAIVFDAAGGVQAIAQQEFAQHFPQPGWVEHNPDEILGTTIRVCREALGAAKGPVSGIGIANQRETTLLWDRDTGRAVYNAIVWQDRRTAGQCEALKTQGLEPLVAEKTGLLLDPYFSGTKLTWLLDNVAGVRERAEAGRLAFGTIDTFLIWHLTGGTVHATDATNASRTMLFDIHCQRWDEELLTAVRVPRVVLPVVQDSASDFGTTAEGLFPYRIPIGGVVGDQQGAMIGQACFQPGMVKSTYGTGCFAVMNTGKIPVGSNNRLLTTVAYRIEGEVTYALEGSIFVAGAAVQWLRDQLRVISSANETESLAERLPDNQGVYMVPAFAGLGAPHWDPDARGAIFGLTRDSGPAHLARAALESVCYQTRDLITAMNHDSDSGSGIETLRVDGGMVANGWLMQFLADIVDVTVERPLVTETTAFGAAYLAGMQVGMFDSFGDVEAQWQREALFSPRLNVDQRTRLIGGWERAVGKVVSR